MGMFLAIFGCRFLILFDNKRQQTDLNNFLPNFKREETQLCNEDVLQRFKMFNLKIYRLCL